MSINPAGWYPDPFGRAQTRWWSGAAWTEHVGTNGQSFIDPPVDASHAPVPHEPVPMSVPAPAATPGPPAVAAAPVKAGLSAMQKMGVVGVAALLVGAAGGYFLRGDSSEGSSGSTGNAPASLSTPILQGLASLNTYEWSVNAVTVGPAALDRSEMVGNGAVDTAANASHQKMTTTDTSTDDPEASTGVTETWNSATSTCTFDGESYTVEERNPFESDLGSVLAGVFDIVVPAGNAQLVGTEQVAGVSAKHYTFTIAGLGAGSGAQVDTNTGDVWVAADGGYLLKYVVNTSMRSGPAGDAASEQYSITLTLELTTVNQPVNVATPADCVA
ncbi:MAG: DUF2510 domain-containing protein [Ilumatobacteraceae bacterium]